MLLMPVLRSSGLRLVPVWLAVAVFFSAQNVLVGAARHRPFDWQWDVYHEFVYWLTWAAFTPLALIAAHRWPLGTGPAWRTVARHLCVMALLAPLQITTTYTLHYFGLALAGQRPAVTLVAWLIGLES